MEVRLTAGAAHEISIEPEDGTSSYAKTPLVLVGGESLRFHSFWDTRSEVVPWSWPNTASMPCSWRAAGFARGRAQLVAGNWFSTPAMTAVASGIRVGH